MTRRGVSTTTEHLMRDIGIVMWSCVTGPDVTVGKAVNIAASLPLGCVSISVFVFRFVPNYGEDCPLVCAQAGR